MPGHHDHHDDGADDDHDPDQHHRVHFDDAKTVARTEHEARALTELVERAVAAIDEVIAERPGCVVDLGCGPGAATLLLAQRFPEARIVAADGSPAMLARAGERIAAARLGERVSTMAVELPGGLDQLPVADVLWASMVVHHVGDERALLAALRERVAPGGVLALVEHAAPIELVTPARHGDAERWARLGEAWAAWFAKMRAELPGHTESDDHAAMLAAAGFSLRRDEVLTVEVDPARDGSSRRFVLGQLRAAADRLGDHAAPEDLAAVARLAEDPAALDDGALRLRVSRRLLLAQPAT